MTSLPNPEQRTPGSFRRDDELASMDAAQKSLTDALRITYRLLILVMCLLGVLFLFSGLQTVSESEKGVKLRFGAVMEDNVPPGWTLVAPWPAGELIKVQTGQADLQITDSFGPPKEAGRAMSTLIATVADLNPMDPKSRSLVTGDVGIAHTWWTVLWNRSQPASNVRNIVSEDETNIVRAAVENAIVKAAAETTLDSLLKLRDTTTMGEGGSSIEQRVREGAQRALDEIGAGVTISSVLLAERLPPGNARGDYQRVLTAEANAAKELEEGEAEAQRRLLQAAGEVHSVLTPLIDEYERAIAVGDAGTEAETLARINAVIDGEPVEVDGRMMTIAGLAAGQMISAREYRTNQVNEWRARAATFETKLDLYRKRPSWFIANEWGQAFREFLYLTEAEVFRVPPKDIRVWLNSNPAIAEAREIERNTLETGISILRREGEFQQDARDRRRDREFRRANEDLD